MQITVATNKAELAEMGMTAEQLRTSIVDALTDNGCGPDGERVDYAGFNVTVEVVPGPAEFKALING